MSTRVHSPHTTSFTPQPFSTPHRHIRGTEDGYPSSASPHMPKPHTGVTHSETLNDASITTSARQRLGPDHLLFHSRRCDSDGRVLTATQGCLRLNATVQSIDCATVEYRMCEKGTRVPSPSVASPPSHHLGHSPAFLDMSLPSRHPATSEARRKKPQAHISVPN